MTTKSRESLRVIVLKKNFYDQVLREGVKESEEYLKSYQEEIESISSRLKKMSFFTNPIGYSKENSKLRYTINTYNQQYKKIVKEEIPYAENKVKEYKNKLEQAMWLGTN